MGRRTLCGVVSLKCLGLLAGVSMLLWVPEMRAIPASGISYLQTAVVDARSPPWRAGADAPPLGGGAAPRTTSSAPLDAAAPSPQSAAPPDGVVVGTTTAAQGIYVGMTVIVESPFNSNSKKAVPLLIGLKGEVRIINQGGHAKIKFDGIAELQWVLKKNFPKIGINKATLILDLVVHNKDEWDDTAEVKNRVNLFRRANGLSEVEKPIGMELRSARGGALLKSPIPADFPVTMLFKFNAAPPDDPGDVTRSTATPDVSDQPTPSTAPPNSGDATESTASPEDTDDVTNSAATPDLESSPTLRSVPLFPSLGKSAGKGTGKMGSGKAADATFAAALGAQQRGKSGTGKASPHGISFTPKQDPACVSEPAAFAPPPHCAVDHFPLVGEEYLETDWSLDAPEPPVLGCDLPRAVFVGRGQFRCERQGHAVRIAFLNNVSLFLQNHKIPYFLSYGTLLGSYRHGTVAWWDDDADIVVQEEYTETLLGLSPQAAKYNFKFKRSHSLRPIHYKLSVSYTQPRSRDTGTMRYMSATTLLSPELTTPRGCPKPDQKSRIYVDMFLMTPIRFPWDTGLHTLGHDELYSYADIFPVKECWLGGYRFFCPQRTRVVLTRMYKSLTLIHEFNTSVCELQLRVAGSLFSSKWRSERLSGEQFPDVPILQEGPDSLLRVSVPKSYEEELREARETAKEHKTPDARAGCNWYFVESLGGFRKNLSNSHCVPAPKTAAQAAGSDPLRPAVQAMGAGKAMGAVQAMGAGKGLMGTSLGASRAMGAASAMGIGGARAARPPPPRPLRAAGMSRPTKGKR